MSASVPTADSSSDTKIISAVNVIVPSSGNQRTSSINPITAIVGTLFKSVFKSLYPVKDSIGLLPLSSRLVFSAQIRKQADKTECEDKGKSPVESFTGYRDLNTEFKECSNNNSIRVNAANSLVPTAGHNFINSINNFSAAGPSNTAVSPTYEN
nr:hypothetical protein [Tanacetum cinerariifolium]